jgi:hypothetical protein
MRPQACWLQDKERRQYFGPNVMTRRMGGDVNQVRAVVGGTPAILIMVSGLAVTPRHFIKAYYDDQLALAPLVHFCPYRTAESD